MSMLDIKWDYLVTYDVNKFLAENEDLDIPIGERFFEVPTNDNHHKLLVVDSGNRNYKFFVIKFIPLKILDKKLSFSLLNKDDFSGFIDLIDDGNEITDLGYFIEGNLISVESNSEDNKSKMAVDCYVVTTEHWTDWYVNGSYVDSTLDDITRETVCYGSGGGSGGGGTGGSTGGSGTGGTGTSDQTVLDTKIMHKELSQLEANYKHLMAQAELDIYENDLTIVQKFLYLRSASQADIWSKQLFSGDCVLLNGIGDAYRHAMWNALSVGSLGQSLTNQLTTAHESDPFIYTLQSKEKEMDLFNNAVGRNIAAVSNSQQDIRDKVEQAVNNGDLVYLSNTDPINCRATHQSSIIPTHN